MSKKKLHIKVVCRYKGKEYSFIDDHSDFSFKDSDVESTYWWEEGNGVCDCNRSLFIGRYCDPSFQEMPCGDDIELLSQEFIGDWRSEEVEAK